jgi:hypothetical protein
MNDLFAVILAIALGLPAGVWVSNKLLPETNPDTPSSNFAVVDNYKGCEVVRWGNGFADYKYFLHCDK